MMKALKPITCAIATAFVVSLTPGTAFAESDVNIDKPNPWVYAAPVIGIVIGTIVGIVVLTGDKPKETAKVVTSEPAGVKVVGGPWVAPNGGGVALGVQW